jgi:hypothetical protein
MRLIASSELSAALDNASLGVANPRTRAVDEPNRAIVLR